MRLYFYLLLGVGLTAVFTACQSTQNYEDSTAPLFEGSYAGLPADFSGKIKIVSWNIKFAEEAAQALTELQEVESLQDADFLLLQEMDETSVDAIARTLGYNYVYYPASVHPETGRNFGNAILSKWPLSQPRKIALPHESPTNGQTRIAVTAVAAVGDLEISVYSIHTETFVLSSEKRLQQTEAIVEQIDEGAAVVIAGGDLNTISQIGVAALEERFAKAGMERAQTGVTVIRAGKGFLADHIFVRGGEIAASGVWPDTEASDHFPVWLEVVVE
jgi:endonuclease/exonuclease/phosphatase family metal-dependent hydrolase